MKYCLGTVQFGLEYGIQGNKQPDIENVFNILTFAINNGVDTFDTASAYGNAESILGDYFDRHPVLKSNTNIISKMHPDAFLNKTRDKWEDVAVECAQESIKRIRVSKLSAYLFHNASYIFDRDSVNALYKVVEMGLSDKIGVSVYTPDEAMKALEYSNIKVIQIPYNVFDHRLDKNGFFENAKKNGVEIYARSSLLQGLIMLEPNNLPQKVAFSKPYLERYLSVCKTYNISPLDAAISYVGSKKEIDYIVFGVDNINQLKDYLSIQNNGIDEQLITTLNKEYYTVEEKLVNPALWK